MDLQPTSISYEAVVLINDSSGIPKIVETFYEAFPQLADKMLIPFGTHEGSGTASLASVLKRHFPNAAMKETLGLTGQKVRNSPAESRRAVKNWIRRIGIR